MNDCLIVGGGVIGLSLAYELSDAGLSVSVIDQGEIGREASWAGAGILPACVAGPESHPLEQLQALSSRLHPRWAAQLEELTSIDTGYRRCGGIQVARSVGEAAVIRAGRKMLPDEGIRIEAVDLQSLPELAPALATAVQAGTIKAAFHLPDDAQLRNPDHLRALTHACRQRGVTVTPHCPAQEIVTHGDRIAGLRTAAETLRADRYCFAAGAWTVRLLADMRIPTGIFPVRGQMVMFRAQRPPLKQVVSEGSRYIVPRDDGRVLVGSCEEEVGFEKGTTVETIAALRNLAFDLLPVLREAEVEKTWSGLRPGSFDGFPYMGRLPDYRNGFVAAGHFRSGLFLSPATAVVMGQLIRGMPVDVDLAPFRVARGLSTGTATG